MPNRLLRPLLIVEFLIALPAIFVFWSQVGGQYHLDLMFWPWKLGLSLAAAFLITAITAGLARGEGAMTGRTWWLSALLILVATVAGFVTYYYHLNEPSDENDEGDQTTLTHQL